MHIRDMLQKLKMVQLQLRDSGKAFFTCKAALRRFLRIFANDKNEN
jgi:hypothetical protein